MLLDLHDELASRHVALCIVGAHAQLRDLLRAEGLAEKTDSSEWLRTLDSVLGEGNARERSDLTPATAACTVKPGLQSATAQIPLLFELRSAAFAAAWASSYGEGATLDLDQRSGRAGGHDPMSHHLCRVRYSAHRVQVFRQAPSPTGRRRIYSSEEKAS